MFITHSQQAFSLGRISHSERTRLHRSLCHSAPTQSRSVPTQPLPLPRSFSRSDSYEHLYCFRYQSRDKLEQVWDPFLLNTEYARMGLPNRAWKVDHSNAQFGICDTYPPLIYVPRSSTTAMLIGSSQFRSHGRLPVLTYLHANGVIQNVSHLQTYPCLL